MVSKLALAVCACLGLCASAQADGLALPILALDPQPAPSIWSGFHVGTEVFAISGSRGVKGGFGGAVEAGYDHEFANNIVLGVEGSTGFTPYHLLNSRVRGFDYAAVDAKLGYDMGRLMPFVTAGVVLAKPNTGPGLGSFAADQSFNNLFNNSSGLKGAATVGAGVEYAVTNNLHVSVAVSVTKAPDLMVP